MKASQLLLSKGFLGRSMEELKRRTQIAVSFEAIKGASAPRPLYDFNTPETVRDCIRMSDRSIGGFSESNFDLITSDKSANDVSHSPSTKFSSSSASGAPSSYARFHGTISTRLPTSRPDVQRTGFAGFRTPDQRPTMFGRAVWDIDPYAYLALRIRSDGRAYLINVQTESVEPSDLHQHRLFAKRPGEWETVMVKWNDMVRTNHGFVVEPQTEMLRQRVLTVGIGLTDRTEGPFELCIERVWATNDPSEAEPTEHSDLGELRNRKGERIRW
ncbi:complex I intermediate-associated protein 30-domain-containing protein [Mariannaea sp. PMI_226]|nr:complex I intermediate-associated protein 30-domain-containing protein [Mariannaea sp. PMI_226]